MEPSYSHPGDDTNDVLQFLSNYHWVRDDVDATAEIVTRRIQSLVDTYKRDAIWGFSNELVETPIQMEEEESLQDNKVQGDARKYQTLMADIAKQRNCIVTLGTGMGKTLIAMMTIRHFRTTCPKKQSKPRFLRVVSCIFHDTFSPYPFSTFFSQLGF
jgi:superfamily II DNA or RNA helicase